MRITLLLSLLLLSAMGCCFFSQPYLWIVTKSFAWIEIDICENLNNFCDASIRNDCVWHSFRIPKCHTIHAYVRLNADSQMSDFTKRTRKKRNVEHLSTTRVHRATPQNVKCNKKSRSHAVSFPCHTVRFIWKIKSISYMSNWIFVHNALRVHSRALHF